MPRIPLIILVAIGFSLSGCSLQKRSIMPGWHVEKHHQHDAISGAMAEHEPKQEAPNPSLTSSLRVPSSSQPEARMNGKEPRPRNSRQIVDVVFLARRKLPKKNN